MNEKNKTNYEKMASFNVMCYQLNQYEKYNNNFCKAIYDLYETKRRYPYGKQIACRIVNYFEENSFAIFHLKQFKPANASDTDLNIEDDKGYETIPYSENHREGKLNMVLYNKEKGVLLYQTTSGVNYENFSNFINNTETFDNDWITFSPMYQNNTKEFAKIDKITMSFDEKLYENPEYETTEAMRKFFNKLVEKHYTIDISIKAKQGGSVNIQEVRKLMEQKFNKLNIEGEDELHNKITYDMLSLILSKKISIPDDKQRDFEYCKTTIIKLYEELFKKD